MVKEYTYSHSPKSFYNLFCSLRALSFGMLTKYEVLGSGCIFLEIVFSFFSSQTVYSLRQVGKSGMH